MADEQSWPSGNSLTSAMVFDISALDAEALGRLLQRGLDGSGPPHFIVHSGADDEATREFLSRSADSPVFAVFHSDNHQLASAPGANGNAATIVARACSLETGGIRLLQLTMRSGTAGNSTSQTSLVR